MKKVTLFLNKATYLVMLLIASLTMFTGCSDDDKNVFGRKLSTIR